MRPAVLAFTVALIVVAAVVVARGLSARLRLSRAKHPSLQGHARIAKVVARLLPFYGRGVVRHAGVDAPLPRRPPLRDLLRPRHPSTRIPT
jgi:glutamate-1-semialdehyde 2,1-aminomutase